MAGVYENLTLFKVENVQFCILFAKQAVRRGPFIIYDGVVER